MCVCKNRWWVIQSEWIQQTNNKTSERKSFLPLALSNSIPRTVFTVFAWVQLILIYLEVEYIIHLFHTCISRRHHHHTHPPCSHHIYPLSHCSLRNALATKLYLLKHLIYHQFTSTLRSEKKEMQVCVCEGNSVFVSDKLGPSVCRFVSCCCAHKNLQLTYECLSDWWGGYS